MIEPLSIPVSAPSPVAVNTERSFIVCITPCIITKQFDRCIMVKLGTIEVVDSDGTKKIVEVEGAFSRDGLRSLLTDLETVPDPVGLPSQEEVKTHTPYQWAVVMADGEHVQQYPLEGGETPFALLHLPNVAQFWILPRQDPESLPWYGLIVGKGFVKRNGFGGNWEWLKLPHPGEQPFAWHYYRNNTLHFMACGGQTDALPPHVRQVLGWRLPQEGGEDLVFEIGVEPDGSWQVFRREPLEHPFWREGS